MVELNSIILKIIAIVLFLNLQSSVNSVILKFTKIECQAFDKSFADIAICQLKVLARNKIGLNVHVRLYQLPVNSVTVNAAFFMKDSVQQYHPFMYNSSVDFCKFLTNSNRFQFWKIVYNLVKSASNVNHTCPYDHDIIINNLILDGSMLKKIPFPSGEYLVILRIMAYNDLKAEIRSFAIIQE